MPTFAFWYERVGPVAPGRTQYDPAPWRYWLTPYDRATRETTIIHTNVSYGQPGDALDAARRWVRSQDRGLGCDADPIGGRRPACAVGVVYEEDTDHPDAWQWRESDKQYSRKKPVWLDEDWYREAVSSDHPAHKHFLHVSENDPALLAYTESDEKGRRDIQTPIKPGRYLTRFFANTLTPKQIAMYASWQVTGNKTTLYSDEREYLIEFAHTPDAIVEVYTKGPQSCMSGDNWEEGEPSQVYGAGDLAVAYMTRKHDGRIIARALVWPAKKVLGRVYPTDHSWERDGFTSMGDSRDCAEAMSTRLLAQGYRSFYDSKNANFDGAKLLKIVNGKRLVMPYLDNGYRVNVGFDHCIMSRDGDYCADSTDGYIDIGQGDDTPEYDYTCENCEEGTDELYAVLTRVRLDAQSQVTYRARDWCEHCRDNHAFYCEGLQEYVTQDTAAVAIGFNDYALAWLQAEGNGFQSEYSGQWFLADDRVIVDGEAWSQDEADEHATYDPQTHEWTRNDADTGIVEDARQPELVPGD